MISQIFIDGRFVPLDDALICIDSRGFCFGDGVFTSIRVVDGRIECFERHLERLKQNCQSIQLIYPEIKTEWAHEIIKINSAAHGIWRMKIIVASGHMQRLNLSPRSCGNLIISVEPYQQPTDAPYRMGIFPEPVHKPSARIKSLAYLDRLWVKDFAHKQNLDDAVTMTCQGELLEAAFSNLFWINENHFYTPDPSLPLLKGISLSIILEAVSKLGMHIHFVKAKLDDIPESAHVFLSNAMIGFHPVCEIAGRAFERNRQLEQRLWNEREKLIHS